MVLINGGFMNNSNLMNELVASLEKVYFMEAFNNLTEFLQGELYILHFLSQNLDQEIYPSGISSKLHLTRPRVTAILSTLKQKGYVETAQNEDDRRRLAVRITREGLNFINDKQKNTHAYFQLFIDSVGEENTKELIRIINLAVSEIDKKSERQGE